MLVTKWFDFDIFIASGIHVEWNY